MKHIVMLTGSPHPHGASHQLADACMKGAAENGHDIYRFDAGLEADKVQFLKLDAAERTIISDDYIHREVLPRLQQADVVVFAASLYYFGMNAQLKAVIDRFYEINHELKDGKACVTLLAGYGQGEDIRLLVEHFAIIRRYLRWKDAGQVIAEDSWNARKLQQHIQEAYEIGKAI
ncbi:flavodoxin family protein [Eikenella sp. S3360]|uniref:Flavodoxin family protein n=1 Tax=Eikenella glucosivorans TaxID=2766967 RepID=A0ABS0NB20_9NEIS|nr:NAD(P)H-dependent oxidoreductase [Eikenella glucosivorans]MBH5329503.1 flavodoxin family protein [Eikenella glucosivorans]